MVEETQDAVEPTEDCTCLSDLLDAVLTTVVIVAVAFVIGVAGYSIGRQEKPAPEVQYKYVYQDKFEGGVTINDYWGRPMVWLADGVYAPNIHLDGRTRTLYGMCQ